jgi:hypothetical protein
MTQIQWQQLEATVAEMTEAEKQRLADLLKPSNGTSPTRSDPTIGLFADDPELIEQIIQDTYIARETHPFRTGE